MALVNKKAYYDYSIEKTYEAGIELTGTEIKSIRSGKVNLKDSFARIENGEAWAHRIHISPYEQGNIENVDPYRIRKLLLHKREINELAGRLGKEKGLTLVPLKLYFKRNLAKIELALAKGKRQYDKRDNIAKREAQRQIERAVKKKVL